MLPADLKRFTHLRIVLWLGTAPCRPTLYCKRNSRCVAVTYSPVLMKLSYTKQMTLQHPLLHYNWNDVLKKYPHHALSTKQFKTFAVCHPVIKIPQFSANAPLFAIISPMLFDKKPLNPFPNRDGCAPLPIRWCILLNHSTPELTEFGRIGTSFLLFSVPITMPRRPIPIFIGHLTDRSNCFICRQCLMWMSKIFHWNLIKIFAASALRGLPNNNQSRFLVLIQQKCLISWVK